jgi:hypothetical protein
MVGQTSTTVTPDGDRGGASPVVNGQTSTRGRSPWSTGRSVSV